MAERFACEKCSSTGKVRWGDCHACKGRGSFATSPEKRAKRQLQRLTSRKAGAQQTNRDTSVYLAVMNRDYGYTLFIQMRVDHDAGRCWTPDQISSARSIFEGIRNARQLFGESQMEPRAC